MSSFLLSGLLLTGCGTQDATGQWVDVAPVTTAAPAQQPAADNNNSNDTAVLIMDPILLIAEMEKTWAGSTKCCKYRK